MFSSLNIFGQSDKLNLLFDQYQDTEGVTSIKIAKPMFRLLGNLNIEDEDLKKSSNSVDVSENIKNILDKLPPNWRQSCILGAEKLYEEFGII